VAYCNKTTSYFIESNTLQWLYETDPTIIDLDSWETLFTIAIKNKITNLAVFMYSVAPVIYNGVRVRPEHYILLCKNGNKKLMHIFMKLNNCFSAL
jgi:hypothetical protein